MERWWNTPADGKENAFTVVELKLHDPSAWKLRAIERASLLVSKATADMLERIRRDLVLTPDLTDPEKLGSADLAFTVNAERAERVRKLLAQEKFDKDGGKRIFSNAYRFVSCEAMDEPGRYRVMARLAIGIWKERVNRKGETRSTHTVSIIAATTGFQQLLATYYAASILTDVPAACAAGICQEAAQQVTSYIGQIASAKVKGEVNYPTVEDRDPTHRRRAYEDAIDALARDLRPLARAQDGDRLKVNDERWSAITRSPDPRPIPLLFVEGKSVRLLEGSARFDTSVSKADRHRGVTNGRDVSADRPERVRNKGSTGLQAWYAEIPLLDAETVHADAEESGRGQGRGLDLGLRLFPIQGGGRWKPRVQGLLVPLSGNRDRIERILRRRDLKVAWTRLTRRHGEWYLQLTLRIPVPKPAEAARVLGIAFGLDAIASWSLADREGNEISTGALAPNAQIASFLREKRGLEWDQAKGRWIGGHGFDAELATIAHTVTNRLIELAREHGARLAVEDVSYVQKASRDSVANVLFTAWNYGQLRRFLGYKAALAGQGEPLYASDYVTNLTCPACGAIRKQGENKEKATTWRENGSLRCRPCGAVTAMTGAIRARRVALHGVSFL